MIGTLLGIGSAVGFAEGLSELSGIEINAWVEIIPEDPSFCTTQCYPALINGRLEGVIVFPKVKDYPENKMELIASQNIKEAFSVKEGDVLGAETL